MTRAIPVVVERAEWLYYDAVDVHREAPWDREITAVDLTFDALELMQAQQEKEAREANRYLDAHPEIGTFAEAREAVLRGGR